MVQKIDALKFGGDLAMANHPDEPWIHKGSVIGGDDSLAQFQAFLPRHDGIAHLPLHKDDRPLLLPGGGRGGGLHGLLLSGYISPPRFQFLLFLTDTACPGQAYE